MSINAHIGLSPVLPEGYLVLYLFVFPLILLWIHSLSSSLCLIIHSLFKIIGLILWRSMSVMTKSHFSLSFFAAVRNRDFFLNKCRHSGWLPEFQLWRKLSLERCSVEYLSFLKLLRKSNIFALPWARQAKTVGLCLGVLQLGTTVKRTFILLSFWVPPTLCWKKPQFHSCHLCKWSKGILNSVFLSTTCKQGFIRVEIKEKFHF